MFIQHNNDTYNIIFDLAKILLFWMMIFLLCFIDEEGDAFYLVIEGTVNILKKENVSSFSITKVVERGLFFGELALINGTKRSATA